jgi:hypothetical protein
MPIQGDQEATLTDRRLAQLSALSQLDFLAIGKSEVSDAGLIWVAGPDTSLVTCKGVAFRFAA